MTSPGPVRTTGHPQPPTGDSPPTTTTTPDGETIDLLLLAQETCRRYRREFPDEKQRYGAAGPAWCVHDNQYLLSWAFLEVRGYLSMETEVAWLASVLEARDFPLDRLARTLEIASDVVQKQVASSFADSASVVLQNAAAFVMSRRTFLT